MPGCRGGCERRGYDELAGEADMSGQGPAGSGVKPRVFLVDDHGMFRSGVRSELAGEVDIVGEAADVGPAIADISESEPDVVLLDVHLPGGNGQEVVAAVKAAHPEVKFLALSASDAPEDVISVKTVESHVSSVLRKLQLSTRHQLSRWAAERRLT